MLSVVGVVVYKEKLSFSQVMGFVIALSGFALFYYDQFTSGYQEVDNLYKGVLIIVVAAVCWVIYAAIQKHMGKTHSVQKLNMVVYLVPTLIFLPWVDYGGFVQLDLNAWLVMIFLGLNTLFAYGSLGEALKYAPANKVSIIITLNPIITLITMKILNTYEYEWLGTDTTSIIGYFGAFLVIIGAILVVLKNSKK